MRLNIALLLASVFATAATAQLTNIPEGVATASGDDHSVVLATASSGAVGAMSSATPATTSLESVSASASASAAGTVKGTLGNGTIVNNGTSLNGTNGTNSTGGNETGNAFALGVPTGVQVLVGPAVALVGAIGLGLVVFA